MDMILLLNKNSNEKLTLKLMLIDVNCYSLNPNYVLGLWDEKTKEQ